IPADLPSSLLRRVAAAESDTSSDPFPWHLLKALSEHYKASLNREDPYWSLFSETWVRTLQMVRTEGTSYRRYNAYRDGAQTSAVRPLSLYRILWHYASQQPQDSDRP